MKFVYSFAALALMAGAGDADGADFGNAASDQSFNVVPVARNSDVVQAQSEVDVVGTFDFGVAQCRAPFGDQTYFLLDNIGSFAVVQHDLRRLAYISSVAIQDYKARLNEDLARIEQVRQAMLQSPLVTPEFKDLLRKNGHAPDMKRDIRRLRGDARPTKEAREFAQFVRLNAELEKMRSEATRQSLGKTILHEMLTCGYDLRRVPFSITNPQTGQVRMFGQVPRGPQEKSDWRSYEEVSLYEVLLNFGHNPITQSVENR